jgi:hypothetical protein
MDPPDDTYSFDFFEDEPPAAAPGLRGRLPRRARRRGAAPQGPPRQMAPLLRLLALVFVVILVLLVFVLLINSCASVSRHDAYASYMEEVNTIAQASSADGAHAVSALTTQGLTVPQMVRKLRNIAAAEQQNVQAARSLAAPGRLRGENSNLIEALQLRVLGLDGLAGAFQKTVGSKTSSSTESLALSRQAYRLLASDILWDDLFLKPAATQLSRDGVGGVNVPESHFLADPNLIVTPRAMSLVVRRLVVGATSKGTPAGLHGTDLVSVEALSKGSSGTPQLLSAGTLNTVTTSSSLVFRVTIHDGGNFQEVHIPVQLTIGRPQAQGGPITRTATVEVIDPGSNASVVFADLGQVPFAAQTTVTVDVARVPGETDTSNNSAQYNVIFSLPAG